MGAKFTCTGTGSTQSLEMMVHHRASTHAALRVRGLAPAQPPGVRRRPRQPLSSATALAPTGSRYVVAQ
jgi:hypothetical protein